MIGNLVQQGVNGQNGSMLEYKLETSNTQNPDSQLFVINNTFVNQRANAVFLNIEPSTNVPAIVKNNIFYGGGIISTQASAILSNNLTVDPLFVNAASFDYRLQPGSPAINAGVVPGSGSGQSLNPDYEYIHPTCGEGRVSQGTIDIGAYEYGGGGASLGCSGGSSAPVLSSLTVSPSAVVGGTSLTGTVSLNSLAPSGGALVNLSSSNSSVASTPVSITVPAGASSVTFPILTGMVSSVTAVTFTATYAGVSLTANLSISPMTGSALFLKTDIATQGNWKSVYGGEGAVIVGDSATYPSYATVTPASNNAYVWAASTSDARALLKAASSSDRVAGCWYSSAGFTIALNFTDGQTHQVGLYALDFDSAARNEKIEVLDSTGTVLDTRTLSNFTGGQYLVWTLGGRVTLRVTNVSGANAVIGGIFFGSPSAGGGSGGSGSSGSAAFLKNDTNTAGNWKSVYGGEGAVIVGDSAKYPTYATVTPASNNAYVWAASTSDARALLKAASSSDRVAGCWYSSAGFTIALNFTDGQTHQVGLYALFRQRRTQ